ncbi:MAG: hypothetical protein JKY50_00220 [Oleispira sp.]|nr:hypothetical protein [Oleispira sp.]
MAKTRTVTVEGIANWAKVFEQNRDMKGWCGPTGTAKGTYEDCDGAYTLNLIMDTDNSATLKASGSMKELQPADDGLQVKLIRKHKGPFEAASGAPKVFHKDGTPWDIEVDGTIGNGSRVSVTSSIYDIKSYGTTGTRLESVTVLDLVVYEKPPEEPEAATGEEVTV